MDCRGGARGVTRPTAALGEERESRKQKSGKAFTRIGANGEWARNRNQNGLELAAKGRSATKPQPKLGADVCQRMKGANGFFDAEFCISWNLSSVGKKDVQTPTAEKFCRKCTTFLHSAAKRRSEGRKGIREKMKWERRWEAAGRMPALRQARCLRYKV